MYYQSTALKQIFDFIIRKTGLMSTNRQSCRLWCLPGVLNFSVKTKHISRNDNKKFSYIYWKNTGK